MKYILLLILLCGTISCHAQEDTCKCDSGYSDMPSITTSSLEIEGGHCLPDSTVRKLWKALDESLCLDGGSFSMTLGKETKYYTPLSYQHSQIWNDSTGCEVEDIYEKNHNGKRIRITKDEYEKIDAQNKINHNK